MALLTKSNKTKKAINTKNTPVAPVKNQTITLPGANPLPTSTPANPGSLFQTLASNAGTANSTANTSNISKPIATTPATPTPAAPTNTNTSLSSALNNAAKQTLTGDKGPFTEVPNVGSTNGFQAALNPTTVVPSSSIKNDTPSLSDAIRDSVAQSMQDLGFTPSAPGVHQQIAEGKLPSALVTGNGPGGAPGSSSATSEASVSGGGTGGTGSGGGSGSGGSNGSNGTNGLDGISGVMPSGTGLSGDLYDLFNQRLNEYNTGFNGLMQALADSYNTNNSTLNSQYQALLDALNNNYNTNNSTLDDQYNAVLKALGLNLDDTTNLLDSRLKAAQDALEEQRRRSLQEAYISRMMNQRSLRDQLAASGLTGGATETVLANLLNNYQNSRNNIERDTQTNLRELLQTYLDNMSEARQKYNTGVADAENYRVNARQNLANSLLNQQQSIANSRTSAIQSLANSLLNQQQNALNYYQNNRAGAWDDLFNTVAKMYLANM